MACLPGSYPDAAHLTAIARRSAGCVCWLLNRPTVDPRAGGRLETAIEHVWVKVNLSGPLDRASLGVDVNLIEDFSVVANRSEYASPSDQLAQVDLLDGSV